jgi:hypothetical protein
MDVGSGLSLSGSSTVSLWFRRTGSVSGYGGSLIATAPIYRVGFENTFAIALKNGTDVTLESYDNQSGSYTNPVASGVVSTNTWHHLALVLTSTDASTSSGQFYLDGSTIGSAISLSGRTLEGLNEGFTVASYQHVYPTGYNYFFPGQVDEVSVFDSALSASDITTIYNSGAPNDISSLNPVGWWRMGDNDGGTGTTITDQGSGGNDGTLVNGPTFSTDVPLGPLVLPSITNTYSVDFDGTNDYMDFGTNTTINISSAFSVSAWFNVDNISSFPAICLLKTNQSNGFIIALSNTTGANQIYNGVWFGSAPTGDTNQIKGFATGNTTLATALSSGWHHLVFTYDGLDTQSASSSTVYIDGVEYTSSQAVGLPSYSNVNYVAKGGANFNGLIDEFAIFNTELTQREVTGIYNSGTPNDISSLNPVGWWRMGDNDGGTGTTITDQGSGGNDGTLTNGPTFSTTVPS